MEYYRILAGLQNLVLCSYSYGNRMVSRGSCLSGTGFLMRIRMVSRSAPEPDHDEIHFPARSVCNQKSRQQQNGLLWEHRGYPVR